MSSLQRVNEDVSGPIVLSLVNQIESLLLLLLSREQHKSRTRFPDLLPDSPDFPCLTLKSALEHPLVTNL